MIALDTNVLVRFLVEDDAGQTKRARGVVERVQASGELLFVSDVVLCELVWVLRFSYEITKAEVVDTLGRLLAAKQLSFESSARLLRAVAAFAGGPGDLADYVIREQAHACGCTHVMTFDKRLLRDPLFAAP